VVDDEEDADRRARFAGISLSSYAGGGVELRTMEGRTSLPDPPDANDPVADVVARRSSNKVRMCGSSSRD